MSRWVRLVLVAAVAAGVASLPACGKKSDKPKIAVVTNCTDPFWDLCEAGAKKAAQDFDVDLQFRQPKAGTTAEQQPIIDAWVNQGVSGIAVSVIDKTGQAESLKLVAQKVPLITMDNDAPGCGRKCYVGVDNKE